VVAGSDLPVLNWLFVHGLGASGQQWRPLLNLLPWATPAVIVDLSGHGRAAWRADGRYSVRSYMGDLAALASSLPAGRWALVGHSLGARLVLELARTGVINVAALVLVDPPLSSSPEAIARVRRSLDEAASAGFASESDYLAYLAHLSPLADPSVIMAGARDATVWCADGRLRPRFDPRIVDLDAADEATQPLRLRELVRSTSVPILIARGSGSALLSAGDAQQIVEMNRDWVTLATVPRAGHAVMLDNPVGLSEAISAFASASICCAPSGYDAPEGVA
jgi:pimeloyl-ACP methyl ester carboxylesterase